MKRKLLAALCVTAMSAGLLAGCGSSDKTEESTKTGRDGDKSCFF